MKEILTIVIIALFAAYLCVVLCERSIAKAEELTPNDKVKKKEKLEKLRWIRMGILGCIVVTVIISALR